MFEITFLGTSASAPSVHRGLSAHVVKHNEHRFLIDCGEGTQRQILRSGLGFKRLNKILITHGHLDHILGLGGLLSTLMRWETLEDMEIWGGQWALQRIDALLNGVVFLGRKPPVNITYNEITPGVIFETEDFSVNAFRVHHRHTECFGFAFDEKPRRPFINEKAEALSIPPGPWRRDLVIEKSVTLPDGRVIHPDDVLGPARPGTRYVHVGDAGQTYNLREVCQDADALVIESTYMESEKEMAQEFGHLTAKQAGTLAAETGVKNLILTHISRRYRERDILAEAQETFPEAIIARDLDVYQVKRDAATKIGSLYQNYKNVEQPS